MGARWQNHSSSTNSSIQEKEQAQHNHLGIQKASQNLNHMQQLICNSSVYQCTSQEPRSRLLVWPPDLWSHGLCTNRGSSHRGGGTTDVVAGWAGIKFLKKNCAMGACGLHTIGIAGTQSTFHLSNQICVSDHLMAVIAGSTINCHNTPVQFVGSSCWKIC